MNDTYKLPMPSTSLDPSERSRDKSMRLGWMIESKTRGSQWLSVQRSSVDISLALDVVAGTDTATMVGDSLSDARSSEIKHNIKELVSELANMRSDGQVRTENKQQYDNALVLQKRYKSWFTMTRAKRSIRDAFIYGSVLGTGGIGPRWDPRFYGPGRGETRLDTYGPSQMLPDGLPGDGNFQNAYIVHLVREMSIQEARMEFPEYSNLIQPDRGSPSGASKRIATFEKYLAPVFNLFGVAGGSKPVEGQTFPTVDINYSYVRDYSINTTGQTVTMGTPGTMWEYQVPSLGSDIRTGIKDPSGAELYRKATPTDCLFYPMRRLVIWTSTCLIYDDSSYYWHGQVPLVRFKIDDWPWEANGMSMVRDNACVQRSITSHMRNIDDACAARLNPSMMYDESLVSDSLAEKLNPRVPGGRVKVSMALGGSDMVKPLVNPQYYDVPAIVPAWVETLKADIRRNMLVNDVNNIVKARTLPAGETLDKMLELAGPMVRDILDGIELSMSELGNMLVYNFFEFDTTSRLLEILGDDGLTTQQFDYDPGTLVPSHMPEEDPEKGPSIFSPIERAKRHAQQFFFYVTPGSLHELSRTQNKLMLIQAIKGAGLQVDSWTKARIFGIDGYGPEPEGTHNVMERLVAERRMAEEAAARAQALLQSVTPPDEQGKNPVGRPTTGIKSPQLVQKDDGTRSTITQS